MQRTLGSVPDLACVQFSSRPWPLLVLQFGAGLTSHGQLRLVLHLDHKGLYTPASPLVTLSSSWASRQHFHTRISGIIEFLILETDNHFQYRG